jgi:hypothetical protein
LAVYVASSAPSITWRNEAADSGDLVTAAFTLGIPHPSGYPLYTLLAALFARLPVGEPAHNVALLSALAAAGAVVLLSHSARVCMPSDDRLIAYLAPPGLALTFAFAPAFWSQATVAELYALSTLFAAGLVAVLLCAPGTRAAWALPILGLALAHHLTILLLVPSALLLLPPIPRRTLRRAALVSLVPLVLYLYLPLRAAAHPPVNWGDPHTLPGFLWTVTGAPYRAYLFDLSLADLFSRVSLAAAMLFQQFGPWGVLLGLWGAAQMALCQELRRLFVAFVLGVLLAAGYAVAYASRNSFVYLLPAFILFALWMAWGAGDLARRLTKPGMRAALVVLLLFLPAYNLISNFGAMDLSHDREAYDYAASVFSQVPSNAVVIADGDRRLFALWYYRYVVAQASAMMVVSGELLQYDWYYEEVRRLLPGLPENPPDRERLGRVVDRSLAEGRDVYATSTSGWAGDYAYRPVGTLYWIQTRPP